MDINEFLKDFVRDQHIIFLKKSAESGNVIDQYRLGHFLNKPFGYKFSSDFTYLGIKEIDKGKSAGYWLRKAAIAGNVHAQYELGIMYYDGLIGESIYENWSDEKKFIYDEEIPLFLYSEAISWLSKAAKQGNALALKAIGDCYLQFNSISYGAVCIDGEKDEKKAFKYYEEAFQGKCYEALLGLGYCYEKGLGTEQNIEKAFELYLTAHKNGIPEATIKVIDF